MLSRASFEAEKKKKREKRGSMDEKKELIFLLKVTGLNPEKSKGITVVSNC